MKDKDLIFVNEKRRRIFEFVTAHPCAIPSRITASKYTQPVRRHLCELEKHGYVNSYRKSRQRFAYYPAEMLRAEDKMQEMPVIALYACLNGTSSRQRTDVLTEPGEFFRFLYENPNESDSGLARKLDMRDSTLYHILRPFVELKILNKYRHYPAYCNLNLELLLEVVEYHKHREETFLSKVGGEVLNPETKSNFRNMFVDGYKLHLCVNPMKEYLRQAGLLGKAPKFIKTC